MAGKKRRAGRGLADSFAAYGNVTGRRLSYAEYVGLELNAGRVFDRIADAVRRGVEAALSNGPLDPAMVDAGCRTEGESQQRLYEENAERAEARAKAKAGWG